jgi:hypothetical protein
MYADGVDVAIGRDCARLGLLGVAGCEARVEEAVA